MNRLMAVAIVCLVVGLGGGYYVAGRAPRGEAAGCVAAPHAHGQEPAADFCQEHGLPESECPFCEPALIESLGMCAEHDVPEALCTACRPTLIPAFKARADWCAGHGLPESQCELCNPGVLAQYRPSPAAATSPLTRTIAVEALPEHELPRAQRAPSVACTTDRSVIRLASSEVARSIGLTYEPLRRQELRQFVTVSAEVAYDAWRLARLASRAPGVVARVLKDLGEPVQQGEVLAVIDSSDLGAAKAALLQALAGVRLWERNHEREQRLLGQGVAAEREALDAETTLAEKRIELARARQHLRNLGVSDAEIDEVAHTESTSSLLELVAPFDGMLVERAASIGETADSSRSLLAVADTARMWALLDLAPAHLGQVEVGQPVVLTIDGLRGESFAGRLTWISTAVDARTRTIKARAEVDNTRGLLRAGSFGQTRITTRDNQPALLVPDAAVQWEGCCNVVFVRESDTLYRPRKVRLGQAAGEFDEVLEGLSGNELVVTDGSFLLKAELLKGSIGAGCCEVDHLAK